MDNNPTLKLKNTSEPNLTIDTFKTIKRKGYGNEYNKKVEDW